MGCGKTTIGKVLARELGVPFVDTDDLIIARHGAIAEIFARRGHDGFRAVELEAVRTALAGPPAVLALGGGAVTHPPTRELLAERSLRIYLEVPAETILTRLRHSKTVRPVLGGYPTLERVRALMAAREPLYREADLIVPGPYRTKQTFAREIAARVRAHQDAGVAQA
jgi:shikimate kinase